MSAIATYEDYVATVAQMAAIQGVDDPDFVAIIPSVIDYAEQRIYRELDLLANKITVDGMVTTASVRSLPVKLSSSVATLVAVENVAVIGRGSRQPLVSVSRDLLDAVYPNPVPGGLPQWFAMKDQATLLFGPWPDMAYAVEVVGVGRPRPLSEEHPSTFLTTMLPDLFLAASMIFMSGYQKNFGAQADDPRAAMSWEDQYGKLRDSAQMEEQRRKFQGSGWSSLSAPVAATPTR